MIAQTSYRIDDRHSKGQSVSRKPAVVESLAEVPNKAYPTQPQSPARIGTECSDKAARAAPPDAHVDIGASASDDPVRMYLSHIGRYPLLKREQEIDLARRVEVNRSRFRRLLLECDFVLRESVELLRRVEAGELAFDRITQVAVSDRLEKHHILGRLPHHLATLPTLLQAQPAGFRRSHWRKASCESNAAKSLAQAGSSSPPSGPVGRRIGVEDRAPRTSAGEDS